LFTWPPLPEELAVAEEINVNVVAVGGAQVEMPVVQTTPAALKLEPLKVAPVMVNGWPAARLLFEEVVTVITEFASVLRLEIAYP
jgi:hypothetical protein